MTKHSDNPLKQEPLKQKEQDNLEQIQQLLTDISKLPPEIRNQVLNDLPGLITFIVGQKVLSEISDIAEQLFKLPKRSM